MKINKLNKTLIIYDMRQLGCQKNTVKKEIFTLHDMVFL